MSAAPPGAKVLTIRTGRDGQLSARAPDAPSKTAASNALENKRRVIGKSPQPAGEVTSERRRRERSFASYLLRAGRRERQPDGLTPGCPRSSSRSHGLPRA